MKKAILLTTLALLIVGFVSAQKIQPRQTRLNTTPLDFLTGTGYYNRDSTWKVGGFVGVTVSQTALYQWAPGGSNTFSFFSDSQWLRQL